MGSYNFKSSGKTQAQTIIEALTQSSASIGIITPMRFSNDQNVFAVHTNMADQINDNLRNLLQINHGERMPLYDLGANLRPLLTEFTTQEDFDAQAVERIKTTVGKWMPYVSLNNFLSEIDRTDNKNTGVVTLTITYDVPTIQLFGRKLRVTLYVM